MLKVGRTATATRAVGPKVGAITLLLLPEKRLSRRRQPGR